MKIDGTNSRLIKNPCSDYAMPYHYVGIVIRQSGYGPKSVVLPIRSGYRWEDWQKEHPFMGGKLERRDNTAGIGTLRDDYKSITR